MGVTAPLVGIADADDGAEDEARKPLQRPSDRLQVLYAHCSSRVHEAWKLPQTGMRPEFTA